MNGIVCIIFKHLFLKMLDCLEFSLCPNCIIQNKAFQFLLLTKTTFVISKFITFVLNKMLLYVKKITKNCVKATAIDIVWLKIIQTYQLFNDYMKHNNLKSYSPN